MNDRLEAAALYRLMSWLSPAYPVGAFSYSSGIEWAVEAGDIADAETLRRWIAVLLRAGAGMSDGIFFSHAYRAVQRGDDAGLSKSPSLPRPWCRPASVFTKRPPWAGLFSR